MNTDDKLRHPRPHSVCFHLGHVPKRQINPQRQGAVIACPELTVMFT